MDEKILVKYLGDNCVAEIKGVGRKLLNKNDTTLVLKSVYEIELKDDHRWELVKEKSVKPEQKKQEEVN